MRGIADYISKKRTIKTLKTPNFINIVCSLVTSDSAWAKNTKVTWLEYSKGRYAGHTLYLGAKTNPLQGRCNKAKKLSMLKYLKGVETV